MAENKKSFILYADLINNIDHLTNEEKGMLFNHLLEYVNDMNPVLEDRLILTAWKPIERQLKRDLLKFEEVKGKRSDAGKESARLRALNKAQQSSTNPTHVESVQHRSTNPTVSVNDNVNVNVNDNVINKQKEKEPVFNFRKELLNLGGNEQLVSDWMLVRKKLKATNTKTSLNRFLKQVELSGKDLNFALGYVAGNGYKGFEAKWLEQTNSFGVKKSNPQKVFI
tara:strand:- start:45 stop:719 length:675 start_codon:yes stop_codon:yes gene_type:complete